MKQGAKIGVAVVALGAAGGITWYSLSGAKEQAIAASSETKTLWLCDACKQPAELTTKEVGEIAAGLPPYSCPKCKDKKLYHAVRCDKCQTVYISSGTPEATGKCTKCEPEAKPLPPPTEEEAAPPPEDTPTEEQGAKPIRIKKRVPAA